MDLMSSIKSITKNKFYKNVSWIFFGNVIHAVLGFLLNILVARKLSAESYGIVNYAASIITFFTSVCTLGFDGIITKYFAENEEKSNEYLGSTIISRGVVSLLAVLVLQIAFIWLSDGDKVLQMVVFCNSLSLVFNSCSMYVFWFRYKQQANVVAILRLVAFAIAAIWKIVVLLVFESVVLYVLGMSLETAMFALFLYITYKKTSNARLHFSIKTVLKLLKNSYPFIFSAILVTVYAQTDKIMLKHMVDNTAVAMYSVSTFLATAISIIPQTLIEGFRPEIMKYKVIDENQYKKRMRQLYSVVFWISALYGIFITIFAKQIILILYGTKYFDAIPSLSVIVWYTSFSFFGAINNLYFVAENKVAWVQVITFVGAVTNILLNLLLIPHYGIVGAALASLLTQFVANFILIAVIPQLRGAFKLMVEGILFRKIK